MLFAVIIFLRGEGNEEEGGDGRATILLWEKERPGYVILGRQCHAIGIILTQAARKVVPTHIIQALLANRAFGNRRQSVATSTSSRLNGGIWKTWATKLSKPFFFAYRLRAMITFVCSLHAEDFSACAFSQKLHIGPAINLAERFGIARGPCQSMNGGAQGRGTMVCV